MVLEDLRIIHTHHRVRHESMRTQAAHSENKRAELVGPGVKSYGCEIARTAWCKADCPKMLSFANKSPAGICTFESVSFLFASVLECG